MGTGEGGLRNAGIDGCQVLRVRASERHRAFCNSCQTEKSDSRIGLLRKAYRNAQTFYSDHFITVIYGTSVRDF